MPLTLRQHRVADWVDWLVMMIGLGFVAVGGAQLADTVSHLPDEQAAETVTLYRSGSVLTTTRTVERVVQGRIIRLPSDQVVVRVPLIVVRTDDHFIRVPAHNVPLRSAAATVATPGLLATITVHVPVTSYETVTSTVTTTLPPITVPTTITTTLPFDPTSD